MGNNQTVSSDNRCQYYPGLTLGIVGGGQLGRMLAFDAQKMGITVIVLDPKPDAPAAQVADKQIIADFSDSSSYLKLAKHSDVVTYEFEHIDLSGLFKIEEYGTPLNPGSKTLEIIQNKRNQKQWLREHGIAVPDYHLAYNLSEAEQVVRQLDFPIMAKSATGGYDGKGNRMLKSWEDLQAVESLFNSEKEPLILEAYVDFDKELSVMAAINAKGEKSIFPVVENYHYQEILHQTWVPAGIDSATNVKIREMADKILERFKDPGIYGIEFFLLKNGEVLVNEIAPRVHNSGHYSMEACNVSQFQMHLRSILGLPLVEPELIKPAVMINLLGTSLSELPVLDFNQLFAQPETYLHLYGKNEIRPGRKMGHITILGDDEKELKYKLTSLSLPLE